jgi:HTH-type transcriptional regulator/antitoxin HipB
MDYPLKMAEQLRPQLQALRKMRGLTQAKLGEAIGVTQARIVEIEANPGIVNLQQVMQVLNALGATLVIRETEKGASKDHQGATALPTADKGSHKLVPSGGPKKGSW